MPTSLSHWCASFSCRRCWRRSQVRPRYPHVFGSYVTKVVKLTPAQLTQLFAGAAGDAVTSCEMPTHEVSVFRRHLGQGANLPATVAAVRDIEQLREGREFRVTKK